MRRAPRGRARGARGGPQPPTRGREADGGSGGAADGGSRVLGWFERGDDVRAPAYLNRVLIDVHAHFLHDRTPRADWRERNASRLRAGERVGITIHVASILGSWGLTSPIYFSSPSDTTDGNDRMLALQREHP